MKTLKMLISGTVQGVFFRKFIEENASRLGVRGYVRNLEDGRVEVILEGKENEVAEMIEVCKKGSPNSIVKGVKIKEIPYRGFDDFKIIRI